MPMPALSMGQPEHEKVKLALRAGFSWMELVRLLAQYGPEVLDLIMRIIDQRTALDAEAPETIEKVGFHKKGKAHE